MSRLSLNGKRIIVGVALAITLLCLANYWLDLRLFGQFGGKMLIASFGILGIAVLYFGPTVKELEDYQDKKRMSPK